MPCALKEGWGMQGSDRGAAEAKTQCKETHGTVGAEKIYLSEARGHSHKGGEEARQTLRKAAS